MSNENKIKHLEFVQSTITRMNSNSFLLKGWTITLVAALFALAAKDANLNYIMICFIAIPAFWILDGFYVANERKYRALYNEVTIKKENEIDYNMDASKFVKGDKSWARGVFSLTLLIFYGICVTSTVTVMILMKN